MRLITYDTVETQAVAIGSDELKILQEQKYGVLFSLEEICSKSKLFSNVTYFAYWVDGVSAVLTHQNCKNTHPLEQYFSSKKLRYRIFDAM